MKTKEKRLTEQEKIFYEEPMITFLMFTSADIITASDGGGGSNNPDDNVELGEWDKQSLDW